MKKGIKRKLLHMLLYILTAIPYLLLWYGIFNVVCLFFLIGRLAVLWDAYGKGVAILIAVVGVISFLSMLYLQLIMKKKIIAQLLAYGITLLFCIVLMATLNTATDKFRAFTTEKWREYPAERGIMYYDLAKQYNGLRGFSDAQVIELLGEPDEIHDGTYQDGVKYTAYLYGVKYTDENVYVEITEHKVFRCYYYGN